MAVFDELMIAYGVPLVVQAAPDKFYKTLLKWLEKPAQ